MEGDGGFDKVGLDTNIDLKEYNNRDGTINIQNNNWHDSIQGKYGNIVKFYNGDSNYEKEDTLKNHSEVKVTYPRTR